MERTKQMSVATKSKIVVLLEEKKSFAEISRRVGYSSRAVSNCVRKFRESGSLERKKGSGRGRSTTARDDRRLKNILMKDRFQT